MKATDLMIGDWIDIGYHDYNKVQEIARDNDMQWYISYACGITLFRIYEFGPIPLTPEILEKNGWYLDPILKCYSDTPPWLYEEGGTELLLRFSTKESTGALGIFDGQKIRTMSDFLWKGTLYVHELQHTMRLCGFNGLADKFKV